jgi:hypothetical protein
MNIRRAAVAILALAASSAWAAPPSITLIGKGSIPGDALDKSRLTGNICQVGTTNCIPKATLGGLGSAVAYTGHDGVYVAAPDRGPFDGLTDVPYLNRVQFLQIKTKVGAAFPNIRATLLDTRLLKNEFGQTLVGATGAFDQNTPRRTLRFDPEGIRVGLLGTLFISDEYGPYLFEFLPTGRLLRRLDVPEGYAIAHPNADGNRELLDNEAGRQANRGMEGLAITPNDRFLFGQMQNALIQDHGLAPGTTTRVGVNGRILKLDLLTGKTREYVYVVDTIGAGQGVSEILAIDDHEFLVVERDNKSWLAAAPSAPARKTIYKIDVSGATDVSKVSALPEGALPAEIKPVAKDLFINLLDAAFGLQLNDANAISEKIEGLAWGPDLKDGRHVLYVFSDNDLNPKLATQIFAFAIDPALVDFEPQFQPLPIYPRALLPRD